MGVVNVGGSFNGSRYDMSVYTRVTARAIRMARGNVVEMEEAL